MGRRPGATKKEQATFSDGTPKPNTKLQKSLDGLMRVIEDTSRPHEARLRSAEKYAKIMKNRKSSKSSMKKEIDPEALVKDPSKYK